MTDIFTPNPPPALPLNPTPEKNGRRGKRGPRRAKDIQPPKAAKQRRVRRAPTDRHVVQEAPVSRPDADTWTNSEVALLMRINSLLEQNNAADRKKILKALMPL